MSQFISFDELDLRILEILQTDASLSNQALSQRVFASAATTLRRVRALTEAAVIQRIVAILAPEKIVNVVNAICEITLSEQNAEAFEMFEQIANAEPAITQCYRTAPSVDFILVLTLPHMDAYNALVQRVFSAAHNVRNVRTRFATKRTKFSGHVPLPTAAPTPAAA
jgi:Lrp/AsnC family transcriptional regulator, leucine-responsive regulatory protein